MEYRISLVWDDDAQVWYCTSEDIPGLLLESGSLDVLMERARYAAPELLELMENPAGTSLSFTAVHHAAVFA